MHIGQRFKLGEILVWTRRELYVFVLIATIPTLAYHFLHWHWLSIPWLPVSMVGTAVAFLIGFKNNNSYARLWEARQIWGAIVNTSRSWGVMSRDFVHPQIPANELDLKSIHQRLIYRHVAWLTALRFQLRQAKEWENSHKDYAKEYRHFYHVPEWESKLEDELAPLLSPQELDYVLKKKNRATHMLSLQSQDLAQLREQKLIDTYSYVSMQAQITDLFAQQGKCERIKNFPYPRQFASVNLYFVWLFICLLPLGMIEEIVHKMGEDMILLTIPFTILVSWVFHTMEKIGSATENPFEGGANDIPMASMSRTIEIDLREMLEENELPPMLEATHNIIL